MAYFIFLKNYDGFEGSLYRIAENQSDLNKLNILNEDYKIVEETEENFNAIKYGIKSVVSFSDNNIIFKEVTEDNPISFTKENFKLIVEQNKNQIKNFLDNNVNHSFFNDWNNYYNELNNIDINSIVFPLNKTLEQYFKDLGKICYHPLQLP